MNEYYKTGDNVEIGLNFFDVVTENPDGYIIRVNSAAAVSYTHLDVYKRQVLQFVFILP